jgi:hypothetical protein
VPCGQIDALSNTLQHLCKDVDMRVRLGIHGKERLPADYCWDDKLELVRQKIASSRQQATGREENAKKDFKSSTGVVNFL